MTDTVSTVRMGGTSMAGAALKGSAVFWFLVAVAGQWIFAYYTLAFYGGAVLDGNIKEWNEVLPHGIIDGDPAGNAAVAMHMLLSFIITVGGPLQFIPQIRTHAIRFHRWNGRVYLTTAVVISLGGLYMVWTRGVPGNILNALAISLNAVLIIVFAGMVLRNVLGRDIDNHRRWALRLLMVVSGVWFFRVGLMAWILANQGPVGIGENFDGPFVIFWSFGQYLIPLAFLELYFRAQDSGSAPAKFTMAGVVLVLTAAMGVGIGMATIGMWLPRI